MVLAAVVHFLLLAATLVFGFLAFMGIMFDFQLPVTELEAATWMCLAGFGFFLSDRFFVWRGADNHSLRLVGVDRERIYSVLDDYGQAKPVELLWENCIRISVITTPLGPDEEDFFWVFEEGTGREFVYRNEDGVDVRLVDWLVKIPGFSRDEMVAAAASVKLSEFTCWAGLPGQAVPLLDR